MEEQKNIVIGLNDKPIEEMTYVEFKGWCNKRACDGQWSMLEAMAFIKMRKRVDAIKIKGLFKRIKRKETEEAQEKEWQKMLAELNA